MAGTSGAGKSTIVEQMKRDFVLLNPREKFDILSFEFEMLIEDQLVKSTTARTGISLKEVYSAFVPVDKGKMKQVEEQMSTFNDFPIYYVDHVGTVEQITNTILNFAHTKTAQEPDRGLIVTIDHVLLTRGKQGDTEKKIIDDLMQSLVMTKKYLASVGIKSIFIVLSQLNRDIESPERINNVNLHYPNKNDIFAASSVYYCADYVLITHKPSGINGITEFYGPPRGHFKQGLPVMCPTDDQKSMVY